MMFFPKLWNRCEMVAFARALDDLSCNDQVDAAAGKHDTYNIA
jgi:hypothetical protein